MLQCTYALKLFHLNKNIISHMPFWTYKIIFIILGIKVTLHCLTFLPYKVHYIAFLSPTTVWTFFNTRFICLCKGRELGKRAYYPIALKENWYPETVFFFTGLQGFRQKHRTWRLLICVTVFHITSSENSFSIPVNWLHQRSMMGENKILITYFYFKLNINLEII